MTFDPAHSNFALTGQVSSEFAPVEDVFARAVAAQPSGGAALAVFKDGELVVNLAGGSWAQDSLSLIFSISKSVSAIATVLAAQRGELDLREPLANFWPEFDRDDARTITTEMVLSHTAGLPTVDRPLTIDEFIDGHLEEEVARQATYWQPGTQHGYHAFTHGALLNGVMKRTQGRTMAEEIALAISQPLGLDLTLGIDQKDPRAAERVKKYTREREVLTPLQRALSTQSTFIDPVGSAGLFEDMLVFNRPDVMAQTWPATNIVTTAVDLARLFATTIGSVDGQRLLSPEALPVLTSHRAGGIDRMLGIEIHYGAGVQLAFPQLPFTGKRAFGHEGAGGSVAFADPDLGISVAYLTDGYPISNGAALGSFPVIAAIRHCIETRQGASS